MGKKRSKKNGVENLESELSQESSGSLDPSTSIDSELEMSPEEDSESEVALPEIDEIRIKYEELSESFLRLQADFDNARKRAQKEREDAYNYGHEALASSLLGTIDNLERAIDHAREGDDRDLDTTLEGIELVREELFATLERHGVTSIAAEGKPFNPVEHEAMSQQEDDSLAPNTVVKVFMKGYRLKGRLLRPAKVVVSKVSDSKTPADKTVREKVQDESAPSSAEDSEQDS